MNGWDEAWLADYTRQQALRSRVTVPASDSISFTLPKPTLTLNRYQRMHFITRSRYARELSSEVAAAIGWDRLAAHRPWERASVTITRRSLQLADHDGAIGGCKALIDTLLKRSDTHPHGLGVIVDDSPDRMTLSVHQEKAARRADTGTLVIIERLP